MTYKKENYFTIEIEETSANVTTDGSNVYDQELEPKSWIKFDMENFGPSESDHLRLLTQDFREGCNGCAENKTYNYYGALDTNITYVTTAGSYVKFTFINMVTGYSLIDSLYATPFDSSTYVFNYCFRISALFTTPARTECSNPVHASIIPLTLRFFSGYVQINKENFSKRKK